MKPGISACSNSRSSVVSASRISAIRSYIAIN